MFLYIFACWIAVFKHLMMGLTGACNNVAVYLGHYQGTIDNRIDQAGKRTIKVVHEFEPEIVVDHEEMN